MKKRYTMACIDIAYFEIVGCTSVNGMTASLMTSAYDDGTGTLTFAASNTSQVNSRMAAVNNVLKFETE